VADLGAGSGVLSVTARLRGSGPVLAVEVNRADEIESLARLNDVDGITVATSDWRNVDLTGIRLLGRVADLHFTPRCAMLLTASEGERHGTHTRAVSPLS
jgi:hypothetical protein